jgi:phage shock protein E
MKNPAVAILALLISFSVMAAGDHEIAKQAWPMIEEGVLLIDVRSDEEFEQGHIEGAIQIEWDDYDTLIATIGEDKQRPVVFYCRSGNRAGKSATELSTRGYTGIFNATGHEALKATKPLH